jgi:hypothetical protein
MLAGLPNDEVARDRAGYARGLAFIGKEPVTFLARVPVKFADFWGFERNLVDVAEATQRGLRDSWHSPAKLAADLVSAAAYVLLMLAAIRGFAMAPDDRWKLLFGAVGLYFVLVHVVVFGDARFHLPLVPFLALYAAWVIENRPRIAWRSRRVLMASALAVIFVIVWLHELLAAVAVLFSRT